jgi:hypothetical protein
MDHKPVTHEEAVIKRQWIAVVMAFVLFFAGILFAEQLFGDIKYGILGVCIPMLYLGASSIINRVSIIRLRGKKDYSRDQRAVTLGAFVIILAILYLVFAFAPF